MDAVRCSVEYLSEFSDCQSHSVRIIQDDTSLYLTSGDRDVLIFNIQERRVTASGRLFSLLCATTRYSLNTCCFSDRDAVRSFSDTFGIK